MLSGFRGLENEIQGKGVCITSQTHFSSSCELFIPLGSSTVQSVCEDFAELLTKAFERFSPQVPLRISRHNSKLALQPHHIFVSLYQVLETYRRLETSQQQRQSKDCCRCLLPPTFI